MKTLRMLDGKIQGEDMRSLRMAANQMELDYLILIHGTNQHVIDEMLPDNRERGAYLIWVLSDQASSQQHIGNFLAPGVVSEGLQAFSREPTGNFPTSEDVLEGRGENDLEHTVMSFRQELDPKEVPNLVGYEEIVEMLDDLLEIPHLFKQLIRPHSRIGFQRILLFI